jgi:hypothetical protein
MRSKSSGTTMEATLESYRRSHCQRGSNSNSYECKFIEHFGLLPICNANLAQTYARQERMAINLPSAPRPIGSIFGSRARKDQVFAPVRFDLAPSTKSPRLSKRA